MDLGGRKATQPFDDWNVGVGSCLGDLRIGQGPRLKRERPIERRM